ncbi:hypothetical protein [Bdellovibrio bacteriovorus]|uniref:Antitoxin n=1 Tax=Bdellovibrio bacteriovorus str. Tiberius TaxID=1069642 RepID=K7YWE9_BDEBC|nr:hypothetical protein [Bdellovibrio bacteriovorus]AFY01998.1 hypothetical protein Bdt_2315 [Bdellovibrio bacteriovorus str. Tiberius]
MKKEYDLKNLKQKKSRTVSKDEVGKTLISMRINTNDLVDLKTEADRLGIPYQTLMGSILHRYITGELLDKKGAEILKMIKDVS